MKYHLYYIILIFYINSGLFIRTGVAKDVISDIHNISLDSLLNINISTAAKYEQKVSEAPASVTIITAEDIEHNGFRTMAEVFRSVRGFYISDDRNYNYIGVRGFSRPTDYDDRILLLINGHTLNENVFSAAFFETTLGLDLNAIECIEIVHGPGSSLYGTSAMFAVINIITKKGNTVDGLKCTVESGSYGLIRGSTIVGKEFQNDVDIFITGIWGHVKGDDLYYEEFDDPSTNNGVAENLDWDTHYGMLTTINYKDFTIQGYFADREKGVPTAPWEMEFNDDRSKSLDRHGHIEVKFDKQIAANKNIMARGYSNYFYYKMWYPYEVMYFDKASGSWIGSEIRFRWDTHASNRFIMGLEYQNHIHAKYRAWDEDMSYFEGDYPSNLISLYVQNEYQLTKKLSITYGLRHDSYSRGSNSTTPRGAIIYNPFKNGVLKLLYGEAFRVPNIYEKYFEEEEYQKVNLQLKPEKIRTTELIWEQRWNYQFYSTVSLFNYQMNDLIDPIFDTLDSLWQYQNVSQVKTTGIECEFGIRLEKGLRGFMNYSYFNAKDSELNSKLTNSPNHIIKIGFHYPVHLYFYVQGEFLYETERITVYNTQTEPYFLTNINITTKQFMNHIKVSFKIRNLFNENYKLPGGFEHVQPAILQNGRNYTFRLDYMF